MKTLLRFSLGLCATFLLLIGLTKASAAVEPLMNGPLTTTVEDAATATKCAIPCVSCGIE